MFWILENVLFKHSPILIVEIQYVITTVIVVGAECGPGRAGTGSLSCWKLLHVPDVISFRGEGKCSRADEEHPTWPT